MLVDQSECHNKDRFIDKCHKLNGGYVHIIPDCKNQPNRGACWKRFNDK